MKKYILQIVVLCVVSIVLTACGDKNPMEIPDPTLTAAPTITSTPAISQAITDITPTTGVVSSVPTLPPPTITPVVSPTEGPMQKVINLQTEWYGTVEVTIEYKKEENGYDFIDISGPYSEIHTSPDGSVHLLECMGSIYLLDIEEGTASQLINYTNEFPKERAIQDEIEKRAFEIDGDYRFLWANDPHFSPDGTMFSYWTNRNKLKSADGTDEVRIVNLLTGEEQIFSNTGTSYIGWTQDASVFYSGWKKGVNELHVLTGEITEHSKVSELEINDFKEPYIVGSNYFDTVILYHIETKECLQYRSSFLTRVTSMELNSSAEQLLLHNQSIVNPLSGVEPPDSICILDIPTNFVYKYELLAENEWCSKLLWGTDDQIIMEIAEKDSYSRNTKEYVLSEITAAAVEKVIPISVLSGAKEEPDQIYTKWIGDYIDYFDISRMEEYYHYRLTGEIWGILSGLLSEEEMEEYHQTLLHMEEQEKKQYKQLPKLYHYIKEFHITKDKFVAENEKLKQELIREYPSDDPELFAYEDDIIESLFSGDEIQVKDGLREPCTVMADGIIYNVFDLYRLNQEELSKINLPKEELINYLDAYNWLTKRMGCPMETEIMELKERIP